MDNKRIKPAVEAILFASGAPVPLSRIVEALDSTSKIVLKCLEQLQQEYLAEDRGIAVIKLNDSYQMCNKKDYGEYIRKVMDMRRNSPLSQAAMEVLAVIAYNQPVTKAFVEQVRGVDCSGVIGSLTTKNLIEEKGRLELPGRPLLYGTTENFLRCFQLDSLECLPELPEKDNKDSTEDNEAKQEDNTTANAQQNQQEITKVSIKDNKTEN